MQYYYADAQSKEKTFTAPQFGLSMKYPSDWTFIRQEQDLSSQLYDDSMVLSSGVTNIGDFCPSSEIEDEPELFDCQIQSPAHFGITAYKLKPGTNLKELSNQEIHTRNISKRELEYSDLREEDSREILEDLFGLVSSLNIVVISSVIDKRKFYFQYDTDDAEYRAWKHLFVPIYR